MTQREPANNEAAAERREARLAKLSEQYRAGIYHVEAEKVSAKIIDAHLRNPRNPTEPFAS